VPDAAHNRADERAGCPDSCAAADQGSGRPAVGGYHTASSYVLPGWPREAAGWRSDFGPALDGGFMLDRPRLFRGRF